MTDAVNGNDIEIEATYRELFHRSASESELAVWRGLFANGANLLTLRRAILAEPSGIAIANGSIDATYRELFHRSASEGELAVWRGLFADGADLLTLRRAILAESGGIEIADIAIDIQYRSFGGRAATTGELEYWRDQIAQGKTIANVRDAIADDPLGISRIDRTYQDLFGRSADASEVAVWQAEFKGGADANALNRALLAEPRGANYALHDIILAYDDLTGRLPSVADIDMWLDRFANGATHATMIAEISQALSAQVTSFAFQFQSGEPVEQIGTSEEATAWSIMSAPGEGGGISPDAIGFGTTGSALVADFAPFATATGSLGHAGAGAAFYSAGETFPLGSSSSVPLGPGEMSPNKLGLSQPSINDLMF